MIIHRLHLPPVLMLLWCLSIHISCWIIETNWRWSLLTQIPGQYSGNTQYILWLMSPPTHLNYVRREKETSTFWLFFSSYMPKKLASFFFSFSVEFPFKKCEMFLTRKKLTSVFILFFFSLLRWGKKIPVRIRQP